MIERDAESVRIRIPLTELEPALDALLEATADPRDLLEVDGFHSSRWRYNAVFVTPDGELSERVFFERCAAVPALHDRAVAYAVNLYEGLRGVTFGVSETLCHDDHHPAGCFALVPLALADRRHIAALIELFRALDLGHTLDFGVLVDRLLTIHGLGEETLDLLAYWISDGEEDHEGTTLALAATVHGLADHWGSAAAFAARLHRISEQLGDDVDDPSVAANTLTHIGLTLARAGAADFDTWRTCCEALWDFELAPVEDVDRHLPRQTTAFSDDDWRAIWEV